MYKSIFSLSFLLVCLVGFTTPAQAQIKISSGGNAGIGTSPNSNEQLRVSAGSDDIAIFGSSTNSTYAYGLKGEAKGGYKSYGVYGYADGYGTGGHTRIGVYGKTNSGSFPNNIGVKGYVSGSGYNNYGVYGSASGGAYNYAGYFSGNVYTTGSYSSSDKRFKKEIASLNNAGILIKVLQLQPRRYQFYNNEELTQRGLPELNAREGDHFGLVAQELEQIFPELVMDVAHILEDENGEIEEEPETVTTKAINYQELTVVLLAAVQELQAEVEALKAQLNVER